MHKFILILYLSLIIGCSGAENPVSVPTRVLVSESKMIRIVPGSVRVTNTSGGNVIVYDHEDHPKPVIIHYKLDKDHVLPLPTDEVYLVASLTTSFGGAGGMGCIGRGVWPSEYIVCRPHVRARTGRWREVYSGVEFTLLGADREKWKIENPLHKGIKLQQYSPLPGNIVFHPVVLDSSDVDRERGYVQEILDQSDFDGLFSYMPISIDRVLIGEPVVIDTTGEEGRVLREYPNLNRPGEVALRMMQNMQWDVMEPINDFHVALVTENVYRVNAPPGGTFAGGGFAYTGLNLSAIHWTDNMMTIDSALLHEIGHNLGLSHVLCNSEEYIEVNYPVLTGHINVDGYRVNDGHVNVIDRNEYFDFMSYCQPRWISAYSYRKMAEYRLGIEPTHISRKRVVIEPEVIFCQF